MKVYVNWQAEEILSQKQYDQRIAVLAAGYVDDDSLLDSYLEDRYAPLELFTMSEKERADVRDDFAKWYYRKAEEEMAEDYEF